MKPKDIKAVYFIGAGGIGMSAIARYFIKKGLVVATIGIDFAELTYTSIRVNTTIRKRRYASSL